MIVLAAIVGIAFGITYYGDHKKTESTSVSSEEPAIIAIVNTPQSDLNMRAEPTTDADVLTTIPKGTEVTVIEQGDGWWKVEFNDQSGWCSADYLILKE